MSNEGGARSLPLQIPDRGLKPKLWLRVCTPTWNACENIPLPKNTVV